MPGVSARSRALLVAGDAGRPGLSAMLSASGWDVVETGGIAQACFVQNSRPCDVVVLDGTPGGAEALAWLALLPQPIVLVSDFATGAVAESIRHGVTWLPSEIARRHPELLVDLMAQASRRGEERRNAVTVALELREANGRIDRLLGLLWEAAPGEGPTRWFSHRHMLERLDEEVAQMRRRGGPLSLVLGEMRPADGARLDAEQAQRVAGWVASRLAEHKRRCDVAGRYGMDGFMLVLPRVAAEEAECASARLAHFLTRPAHDGLPAMNPRFGHASVPGEAATVQAMLCRAEERLGEARDGR